VNGQDLMNSILQLAIQGKLVEQREEEGTAKELLEKIESEKKQLIKEGKIKKQKKLPEIKEDEIPFDIPESWEWVRLSEIIDVRDGTHDTPKYVANGVPLVTSKNLKQGEIDFDNVKFISIEDSEKINMRSGVDDGDILFAMIGSIGNPVLVNKTRDFSIKNMALFKPIKNTLFNMEYLLNYLQLEQESMKRKAAGGVQSFVSLTFLRQYLIPLPPIEEQKRIVAKIEELMPYVDKYDIAYSEVEELNKKFPEDMQKSILQYAIQGKLVEQREEDGTAEDLYKQIQEEKKKLVNEGKIKKTKVFTEVTEDEIPFDIPESWKWVRLGEIGSWSAGATPSRSNPQYYVGDIPWLKTGDLNDGYISEIPEHISTEALKKTSVRLNPIGSVLMAMYGATIGKLGILNIEATTNQACCACIPFKGIYNKFLFYYLLGQREYYIKMGAGGAQPNISKEKIVNSVIPLPPLEEQKRIVDKIEELLPYCKQLVK
jgi:type I restriction enzyme, S subunit